MNLKLYIKTGTDFWEIFGDNNCPYSYANSNNYKEQMNGVYFNSLLYRFRIRYEKWMTK